MRGTSRLGELGDSASISVLAQERDHITTPGVPMSQSGLSRGRLISFLYPSLAALALAPTACGPAHSQSRDQDLKTSDQALTSAPQLHRHSRVCGDAAPGHARCHAWVRVNNVTGQIEPNAAAPSAGSLKPADLIDAYKLPTTGGAGMTI